MSTLREVKGHLTIDPAILIIRFLIVILGEFYLLPSGEERGGTNNSIRAKSADLRASANLRLISPDRAGLMIHLLPRY